MMRDFSLGMIYGSLLVGAFGQFSAVPLLCGIVYAATVGFLQWRYEGWSRD